jgi:PKD repeat protein
MAWKASIAIDSTINLYSSDNSHPSIYGSYLAACTFYASLFKKSAVGSSYWPNAIDSVTAYSLQQIGSSTVLDSLAVWNIFNSNFSFQQYNDSVICTNLSSNYDSILWDFGDGTTSFDENPTHVYNTSGVYTINLSVLTNGGCLLNSQSINISVNLGVLSWNCLNAVCVDAGTGNGAFTSLSDCNSNCPLTSIKKIELDNISVYPNPSRGIFNLSFTSEVIQDLRVRIFNVIGVELLSDELEQFKGKYTKEINLKNYDKGFYFLEIKNNNIIINKKLMLN